MSSKRGAEEGNRRTISGNQLVARSLTNIERASTSEEGDEEEEEAEDDEEPEPQSPDTTGTQPDPEDADDAHSSATHNTWRSDEERTSTYFFYTHQPPNPWPRDFDWMALYKKDRKLQKQFCSFTDTGYVNLLTFYQSYAPKRPSDLVSLEQRGPKRLRWGEWFFMQLLKAIRRGTCEVEDIKAGLVKSGIVWKTDTQRFLWEDRGIKWPVKRFEADNHDQNSYFKPIRGSRPTAQTMEDDGVVAESRIPSEKRVQEWLSTPQATGEDDPNDLDQLLPLPDGNHYYQVDQFNQSECAFPNEFDWRTQFNAMDALTYQYRLDDPRIQGLMAIHHKLIPGMAGQTEEPLGANLFGRLFYDRLLGALLAGRAQPRQWAEAQYRGLGILPDIQASSRERFLPGQTALATQRAFYGTATREHTGGDQLSSEEGVSNIPPATRNQSKTRFQRQREMATISIGEIVELSSDSDDTTLMQHHRRKGSRIFQQGGTLEVPTTLETVPLKSPSLQPTQSQVSRAVKTIDRLKGTTAKDPTQSPTLKSTIDNRSQRLQINSSTTDRDQPTQAEATEMAKSANHKLKLKTPKSWGVQVPEHALDGPPVAKHGLSRVWWSPSDSLNVVDIPASAIYEKAKEGKEAPEDWVVYSYNWNINDDILADKDWTPPPFVLLDEGAILVATVLLSASERSKRWPFTFTQNGVPRTDREVFGHAPVALGGKFEGRKFRYSKASFLTFRRESTLRGVAGPNNEVRGQGTTEVRRGQAVTDGPKQEWTFGADELPYHPNEKVTGERIVFWYGVDGRDKSKTYQNLWDSAIQLNTSAYWFDRMLSDGKQPVCVVDAWFNSEMPMTKWQSPSTRKVKKPTGDSSDNEHEHGRLSERQTSIQDAGKTVEVRGTKEKRDTKQGQKRSSDDNQQEGTKKPRMAKTVDEAFLVEISEEASLRKMTMHTHADGKIASPALDFLRDYDLDTATITPNPSLSNEQAGLMVNLAVQNMGIRGKKQTNHVEKMDSIRQQFEQERSEMDQLLEMYRNRAQAANQLREQHTHLMETQPLLYAFEDGQALVQSLEKSADKSVVDATVKWVRKWTDKRVNQVVIDALPELEVMLPGKQIKEQARKVGAAKVEEPATYPKPEGFTIREDSSDE
nr:hypothetical protein [Knufia petricola]